MRRLGLFILKNWVILSIGFILTAIFVLIAYEERGYVAIGGEWLTLPILFMGREMWKSIREEVAEWL